MFEQPAFATVLWSIVKNFLTEKLRGRFQFCGNDYSRLKEIIPEDRLAMLPKFLGGSLDDDASSTWVESQLEL
jgi:hypothetical protein